MATEIPQRSPWRMAFPLVAGLALTAGFAWVAFGPGPRQCSVAFSIGFLVRHGLGGEKLCRGAFGVATALGMAIVLLSVAAIVRLRAPGRFADALETTGQWIALAVLMIPLLAGVVVAAPVWLARWVARRGTRSPIERRPASPNEP